MQRRRHRLMARRTTRSRGSRRGMAATALIVLVGLFALSVVGTFGGTAGGLLLTYHSVYGSLPDGRLLRDALLEDLGQLGL